MSARDPELSGFDRQSISAVYQWQALKAEPPILSRSVVSMLLDLTTSMKIETIEFFNAIDILVRTSTVCSRDMVPLFFAAIRLSVFWRRRKDLLSMSRSDIVRSLAARDLQVSDVMEAESDILSCLGCHVWRSYANVLEVVLFVVDTVFGHAAPKEGLRQLNNVCVDLGTVLSSSDVFPLKHRFSVWYVFTCYRT